MERPTRDSSANNADDNKGIRREAVREATTMGGVEGERKELARGPRIDTYPGQEQVVILQLW